MESLTIRQIDYIQRTREARESAKKRQEDVADYIGVARNTYTNYELRRPMPQKYIAKFCKFTNVNEAWLISGSEPMFNDDTASTINIRRSLLEKLSTFDDKQQAAFEAMIEPFLSSKETNMK